MQYKGYYMLYPFSSLELQELIDYQIDNYDIYDEIIYRITKELPYNAYHYFG